MSIEEDINRIANALENIAPAPEVLKVGGTDPEPDEAPAPEPPAAPAPEPPEVDPGITADELNQHLIAKYNELVESGKDAEYVMQAIKGVLGADKISDVDQGKYADVSRRVKAMSTDDV